MFLCIDFDASGFIDHGEWEIIDDFCSAMGPRARQHCLTRAMPFSKDTPISQEEFLARGAPILGENRSHRYALLAKHVKAALQDLVQSRMAFESVDENGDGELDADELMALFIKLGASCTHEECTALIAEYDDNHNGTIDWREFVLSHVHASHVHEGIFHKGSKLESLFNAKAISCIPSIYDQENMMHLVDEAELERMAEAMPPLEFRGARLMSWLQHKLEDQMWSSSRNDTHILGAGHRLAINGYGWSAVAFGMLIGALFGYFGYLLEIYMTEVWSDYVFTEPGDDKTTKFKVTLGLAIGAISCFMTIFELAGVWMYELFTVVEMTKLAGVRLWPLNGERSFIAAALVRAVL